VNVNAFSLDLTATGKLVGARLAFATADRLSFEEMRFFVATPLFVDAMMARLLQMGRASVGMSAARMSGDSPEFGAAALLGFTSMRVHVSLNSLFLIGTLCSFGSLDGHGTLKLVGSLWRFGTLGTSGSLVAYGTLLTPGSLCAFDTFIRCGSLYIIGTLIQYDSLSDFGTLHCDGSLVMFGTLGRYGSLGEYGTLMSFGSLGSSGTLGHFGSLCVVGTLLTRGSLAMFGTLKQDGSLCSLVTFWKFGSLAVLGTLSAYRLARMYGTLVFRLGYHTTLSRKTALSLPSDRSGSAVLSLRSARSFA
jgi:hypothetical protein